jgi:hypothetical protein
MPTDWATSKAADHLFGDNFPNGAEVHIKRLAKLLDEVRAEFETSNTEQAATFQLGMKAERDLMRNGERPGSALKAAGEWLSADDVARPSRERLDRLTDAFDAYARQGARLDRERVDRIVAWLRGDYKYNKNAQSFADAIEKGEYEFPKGPPPVG